MIVGEAKQTRVVMGRLEKGEPVVEKLVELARFEKIDCGFVRGQGAVEEIFLERYDEGGRRYVPLATAGGADGPWELVSLQGNVSLRDGQPEVRLWAVIATVLGARPQVLAGQLAAARAVFVEFAVDVCDDGDLERRDDAVTGLPLWRPPRRR
ncbi:MAG TPA: PPC domain-containing DNA-binding protein [Anaeromyxobacter sp.]|nr:PPC domain-containing DNA-binding protein [Anaeromyxobacter sp.]